MLGSDSLIIEVFVEVQRCLMPVPDEGALGRLLQLAAHHVAYKVKGLRNQSEQEFTYFFACGMLVWV